MHISVSDFDLMARDAIEMMTTSHSFFDSIKAVAVENNLTASQKIELVNTTHWKMIEMIGDANDNR